MNGNLKNALLKSRYPWYTYNLEKGLANWRKAVNQLNGGGGTVYNVNFLGDSLTEGALSDPAMTNAWQLGFVGLIRTRLAALFGDVGLGFIPVYHPSYANTPLFSLGSGWSITDDWTVGVGGRCAVVSSGTNTMTFSFIGPGVRLLYGTGSILGTFEWRIDSDSYTAVNSYSASVGRGVLDISGLSDASHTLSVRRKSGYVIIVGACPIGSKTKGIRVNQMGCFGQVAADFLHSTAGDEPLMEELVIDYWTPTLTVISLILNDARDSTNINNYKSQIQGLITRAKAYGDVLMFNYAITSEVPYANLIPYSIACKEIAVLNDVGYVDLCAAFAGPVMSAAKGFTSPDDIHWTDAGHAAVAKLLLEDILLA